MKIRSGIFSISVFLVLFFSDVYPQQSKSISQIVDQYGKSVVLIAALDENNQIISTGSGFIVRPNGVIITNRHVIEDANHALVKLTNGDVFNDVSIIDVDTIRDIAVIKIKAVNLVSAVIGNSNNSKIGDNVIVIGNPQGLENTVSNGLISGIRDSEKGFKWHQISAPISPGSSGSPVFNMTGEVIGIATASITQGQNLNFSIPINYAIPLVNDIPKMSLSEYSKLTVNKILTKMADAIGGAVAWDSIKDEIFVTISQSKYFSIKSTIYRKNNKERTEMEINDRSKMIFIKAGDIGWIQNSPNEEPKEMDPDMLRGSGVNSRCYIKFLHPEKLGIIFEYLGKSTYKNGVYLMLEGKHNDGSKEVLYVDPNSYLLNILRFYRINSQEGNEWTFSDYRKVKNVLYPFEWSNKNADATTSGATTLSIVINSGFDDMLFSRPIKK
jgi:hypothetical protein